MRVSIHQPQYLPWMPYFLKIKNCDLFIILDNVNFQKNGLQNRNKIKTSNGYHWLTVPVYQSNNQIINRVLVDNKVNWRKKHLQSIIQNYGKAKYFENYIDNFKIIFEKNWSKLVDLNIALINQILKILMIKTRIIKSSDIKVNGKATDLLINLCKEVGATEYISGVGAKDYLLKQKFINNNINLKFNPPLFPLKYKQMHEKINFLNDLSAIDMIMNCGLEWENYFSYEKK